MCPALLYRRFLSRREAVSAGLLQATSLSFVVAATQIGVELGKISTAAAAGLVTGGVVSVLIFPGSPALHELLRAGVIDGALGGPVDQEYLLQARQMQAMSFAVHIPLRLLRHRLPGHGAVPRGAVAAHRRPALQACWPSAGRRRW